MVDDRSDSGPGGPEAGLRGRDLIGLGGLLAGSVIAGLVLGLLVDEAAGSSPVGVLVGIGLGIVAGAVGFVVRVRAALRG
jgi:F0F1-type ATP synthase assembly protein I